jgi:hypothetical protein
MSAEVLLVDAALIDGRVSGGGVRYVVNRAVVVDSEREEIAPQPAAQPQPRAQTQVGIGVEPDITELGRQ